MELNAPYCDWASEISFCSISLSLSQMDGHTQETVHVSSAKAMQMHMYASNVQTHTQWHRCRDASVGADDMMDRSCQCQNSQNQSGADKVHFARPTPPKLIAPLLTYLFLFLPYTQPVCVQKCVCVCQALVLYLYMSVCVWNSLKLAGECTAVCCWDFFVTVCACCRM